VPQGSQVAANFSHCEHKTKSSTGSQGVMAGNKHSGAAEAIVEETRVSILDAVQ